MSNNAKLIIKNVLRGIIIAVVIFVIKEMTIGA